MPVTSVHHEYARSVERWTRCRDAFEGSDAIKAAGTKYLPKLSGQDATEYEAYKMRALWYGATARTVQGLVGAVFRKPPAVEVPELLEAQLQDVTLTGIPFEAFSRQVLQEVLVTGRYGVLVDMASQEAPEQRPYWVGYVAENIRNWAMIQRGGDTVLTLVVLYEEIMLPGDDEFEWRIVPQYRVLRLDEQGKYLVELWRKTGTGEKQEWQKAQALAPTFRGQRLDYIPFCFFGPHTITPSVEKPPLLDLVDVNLSHYRTSADLEHGRHFCGLPTPWVAGFPSETVLRIGSSIAWVANDPNARAGMLEFTGQGLGALEKALESKERLMAVLGARLLEEQKRAAEAAEALTIRQSGERSVLQSIAGTIEIGLTKVLQWHAQWAGAPAEQIAVALNKDFVDRRLSGQELAELVRTWQTGGISYETFYYNLERGEMTRPGVDAETERELIEQQAPRTVPLEEEQAA